VWRYTIDYASGAARKQPAAQKRHRPPKLDQGDLIYLLNDQQLASVALWPEPSDSLLVASAAGRPEFFLDDFVRSASLGAVSMLPTLLWRLQGRIDLPSAVPP
jgi:hypothetical protein